MTRPMLWTRHFQHVWEERSGDYHLPQWLRVASLAYGMHRDNGHARFDRGYIGLILSRPHPITGEMLPDPNPGRAVRMAVKNGWLAEGSHLGCLIVPAHAIEGPGPIGSHAAHCPAHEGAL